jgi:protein-arginine kinase activator protein McsA
MPCGNCDTNHPTDRHQVHLATDEVVELALCEACHERFAAADWVELVV